MPSTRPRRALGQSEEELVRDNNRAHALIENGLAASIVQECAENGHIDLSRAEYLDLSKTAA